MYAIVEIAGQQFKVEKNQKIYVHRLDAKEGDKVTFKNVLLTDDNGKVNVGTPNVLGAEVVAKVLSHMRADKVKVFKKKRRKGYQKLNGHRQDMSNIEIESISLNGKKVSTKKEEPKKVAEKKVETKKTTKKSETDNLTKIEGIGPKIASILVEAGIDTFKKLSETKAEKISEILVAAGGNAYNRFDPTTWPKQAKLAADGKWDELKVLQDELDGGKAN
ncbi:MAG: 50S ribosomal protein L21 [Chlorobi bacterium]|nr:50S ribosomal protein L21 [Chlorobiota bacterium]